MIMSVAHASVDEGTTANLFGAWSNLKVGNRPEGLVECLLLEGEGNVQVIALWQSREHHDKAIEGEPVHPAFVVFEAAGLDPVHSTWDVVGTIGR